VHRPPGDRAPKPPPLEAKDGKEPSRMDRIARFAGQNGAEPPQPADDAKEPVTSPETPGAEAAKGAEKPASPPASKAPAAETKTDLTEQDVRKMPPHLRKGYEQVKKERDTLKQEVETLKSKPAEDPEKPKLVEKLSAAEKERDRLAKEIEYVDYQQSAEYKSKYEQPYVDAWTKARAKVSEFDATQEDGTIRAATAKDFDTIASQPDYRSAKAIAKQMFPDDWQAILNMREGVLELNSKRIEALDAKRKEGEDVRKQRQEERSQAGKKLISDLGKHWKSKMEADHKAFPQYFGDVEGDPKANELLSNGFKEALDAFSVMDVANHPGLTEAQRIAALDKHVRMFNKAAAFDRLAYQFSQQNKKVRELEEKLKEYEKSEPGPGDGGPQRESAPDASGDRINRLAKYVGAGTRRR
jgi:hypothetical protein